MEQLMCQLISYLDLHPVAELHRWHNWQIVPIAGGANNLLYRATSAHGDYAIKFTIRDERDRAGREYAALQVIEQTGMVLAPRAIWLNQHDYRQPVVVQTWLTGEVLTAPPATEHDWRNLLDLYCWIHTITPEQTSIRLAPATLNVASGDAGKRMIFDHLAKIPPEHRPASLNPIITWLDAWQPPTWDMPRRALCRVDSNWRNFLRQHERWVCVDWENAGWGDPAFEWADIITHPAYSDCDAPWKSLIGEYTDRMNDPTAPHRIAIYTLIMRLWWVVRLARYLYEVPHGLDSRLIERPASWQQDTIKQYERYLANAKHAIEYNSANPS